MKKTPNLTIEIQYGDCDTDESPLKKDSFLHKVSMNYDLLVLLKEFYKLIILQELSLVYDMDFQSVFSLFTKVNTSFSIHILEVSYGMTNLFSCCTTKSVLCKYVHNTNGLLPVQ